MRNSIIASIYSTASFLLLVHCPPDYSTEAEQEKPDYTEIRESQEPQPKETPPTPIPELKKIPEVKKAIPEKPEKEAVEHVYEEELPSSMIIPCDCPAANVFEWSPDKGTLDSFVMASIDSHHIDPDAEEGYAGHFFYGQGLIILLGEAKQKIYTIEAAGNNFYEFVANLVVTSFDGSRDIYLLYDERVSEEEVLDMEGPARDFEHIKSNVSKQLKKYLRSGILNQETIRPHQFERNLTFLEDDYFGMMGVLDWNVRLAQDNGAGILTWMLTGNVDRFYECKDLVWKCLPGKLEPVSPEAAIKDQMLEALRDNDFESFAALMHPEQEIQISEYDGVEEKEFILSRAEFLNQLGTRHQIKSEWEEHQFFKHIVQLLLKGRPQRFMEYWSKLSFSYHEDKPYLIRIEVYNF